MYFLTKRLIRERILFWLLARSFILLLPAPMLKSLVHSQHYTAAHLPASLDGAQMNWYLPAAVGIRVSRGFKKNTNIAIDGFKIQLYIKVSPMETGGADKEFLPPLLGKMCTELISSSY